VIEDIKVPILAESVAEATLLNWHIQPGQVVQEGDKIVDIETDKVVLEVVAPKVGTVVDILKNNGENVLSEEIIAHLDTSQIEGPTGLEALAGQTSPVKTSPAVRKLAAEKGIDPATVPHRGDRVTKADLLQPTTEALTGNDNLRKKEVQTTKEEVTVTSDSTRQAAKAVSAPSPSKSERPEERVPMTRLRKRAAERLLNAQHEHAILTTFNEINMKAVMDLRNKHKDEFEKVYGTKLGFMSFFTKAVVAALQKFPIVNASTEGEDIIYHGYYDIGIAVSSPRGLVVPILRDVNAMSFADIETAIADFGKRARDAQLTIEDLTGGTFTITNGGIFGSMLSTPILNPPQSAILGMHNIVDRPVAENGQVVIRPVMYVALSYDHRLVDGRDAVQFLFTVKKTIEDPARLLLDI
jgi:2-oxoglutarate dehydrogenase E2 component (dihydrolipoamide succinyltransferase)